MDKKNLNDVENFLKNTFGKNLAEIKKLILKDLSDEMDSAILSGIDEKINPEPKIKSVAEVLADAGKEPEVEVQVESIDDQGKKKKKKTSSKKKTTKKDEGKIKLEKALFSKVKLDDDELSVTKAEVEKAAKQLAKQDLKTQTWQVITDHGSIPPMDLYRQIWENREIEVDWAYNTYRTLTLFDSLGFEVKRS